MDVVEAIRTRRTHKSFGPEPVPRGTLEELFDLARYAPNHHLTQPWRFRVLGAEALERLQEAAGPADAPKLERGRPENAKAPRLGQVMVGRVAREVEELLDGVPGHGLGAERLVRPPRPDRLDHVHRAPVYLKPLKSGADEDDDLGQRTLEVP